MVKYTFFVVGRQGRLRSTQKTDTFRSTFFWEKKQRSLDVCIYKCNEDEGNQPKEDELKERYIIVGGILFLCPRIPVKWLPVKSTERVSKICASIIAPVSVGLETKISSLS